MSRPLWSRWGLQFMDSGTGRPSPPARETSQSCTGAVERMCSGKRSARDRDSALNSSAKGRPVHCSGRRPVSRSRARLVSRMRPSVSHTMSTSDMAPSTPLMKAWACSRARFFSSRATW